MTLTAETESDAGQEAVSERVRKIREAQDVGVSRAEDGVDGDRYFPH